MADRHVSFEDRLYTQLVELNKSLDHRRFSDTVNYVVQRGLQVLKREETEEKEEVKN